MRFPDDSQRLTLYGKTGSGKTVAGLFHLHLRSWDQAKFGRRAMPWVILDFKRDPTIKRIPRLEEIDVRHGLPRQPGLYVVRPHPNDRAAVNDFLWRAWEQTHVGLFSDEGYMAASLRRPSDAWDAICTQGRTKRIPLITCTQRAAWLSPFTMSETDFHQVLHLENPADKDRLAEWVPGLPPTEQNYHSYYKDVGRGTVEYLAPVPPEDELLDRFDSKMPRRVRTFRGMLSNAGSGGRR